MISSLKARVYFNNRKILLLLIFVLFFYIFIRGLELNLHKDVTERTRYHALPVALSVLYHGHPHDYTGLKAIEQPFQGKESISNLIEKGTSQDVQDRSVYYWVADDKGFEDYIIGAFYLFSAKLISLYYMWFLILFAATASFLFSFHRKLWAVSYLSLSYLGILLAVSVLPLVRYFDPNYSTFTIPIYETRYLDVLSFIPTLHIIIAAFNRGLVKLGRDVIPLVVQFFILFFLYHCRTSIAWQILSIAIIAFSILSVRIYFFYKKAQAIRIRSFMAPALILCLLALSGLMLHFYKHHVYNEKYYQEMGMRTVWHNALMGLGEDAGFYYKYHLSINDFEIARSVINFARNSQQCEPEVANLEPQQLLNTLGGYGVVNWSYYEACARKFYISIIRENKLKSLRFYFITKPLDSINIVSKVAKSQQSYIYGDGWHPFSLINILFLAAIIWLAFPSLIRAYPKLILITLALFIFSLIPTVLFYHVILSAGGLFVTTSILLYVLVISAGAILYEKFNFKNHTNAIFHDKKLKELSIIIPAYNEEKRIAITIAEVTEVAQNILDNFEIIIVDDGSRDETYSEIQKAIIGIEDRTNIIRHEVNQGVGSAFHLGLKLAKYPQLCLVPGDNAFNIEGIKTLFSQCGTVPLVISYRQNMEARTPLRHLLSRIATLFLRLITGFKIRDAHSLYLFPVAMTRSLAVKANGYGYHIETLSRLLKMQRQFKEVPVILNPKPDASSGVMKPKTLLILGITLSKLFGLRLIGKL